MTSIKERLAAAKLPERSLQVCLRGDLAAEFDELEAQLKNARVEKSGRRLGSKSEGLEIADRMREIQQQMADEMLTIRVRAMSRAEWHKLTLQHPPQDDDEGGRLMGVDLEPFMSEAIPACVIEPELDAEDWERLNEVLSSADYGRLLNAVWEVNRTGVDIPKSRLASLVTAESAADSKPQPASE